MNNRTKDNQSAGNRIATYIARAIIGILGIGLLIVFLASKFWKTADVRIWLPCASVIGLFVGYGFGGDIWGARLFDLFTGRSSRRLVDKDGKSPVYVMPKATLFIMLGVLVFLLVLLVRFVWYGQHARP